MEFDRFINSRGQEEYRYKPEANFTGIIPVPEIQSQVEIVDQIQSKYKLNFSGQSPKAIKRAITKLFGQVAFEKEFDINQQSEIKEAVAALHARNETVMYIPVDNRSGGHRPVVISPGEPIRFKGPIRLMQRASGPDKSPFRLLHDFEKDIFRMEVGRVGSTAKTTWEPQKDGVHTPVKYSFLVGNDAWVDLGKIDAYRDRGLWLMLLGDQFEKLTATMRHFSQFTGAGSFDVEAYIDMRGQITPVDVDLPQIDQSLNLFQTK